MKRWPNPHPPLRPSACCASANSVRAAITQVLQRGEVLESADRKHGDFHFRGAHVARSEDRHGPMWTPLGVADHAAVIEALNRHAKFIRVRLGPQLRQMKYSRTSGSGTIPASTTIRRSTRCCARRRSVVTSIATATTKSKRQNRCTRPRQTEGPPDFGMADPRQTPRFRFDRGRIQDQVAVQGGRRRAMPARSIRSPPACCRSRSATRRKPFPTSWTAARSTNSRWPGARSAHRPESRRRSRPLFRARSGGRGDPRPAAEIYRRNRGRCRRSSPRSRSRRARL